MDKIQWKDLVLLPIDNNSISQLFEWRNSYSFLHFLTARPQSHSLEDFKLELKRDFSTDRHLQHLICYRGNFIGTIYSYSYNKLDQYCFISVFTQEEFSNSGLGIRAAVIFCKFLFEHFNLFKIYFDIYDFNYQLISALKKREINIEGQFLKQHLFNGQRHDVIRFAIYSDDISNWIKTSMR